MSSERLPSRDEVVSLVGGASIALGVLLFGTVIGATWVGLLVQGTGCANPTITGACTVLPMVESRVMTAAKVAGLAFVLAFGAEYYEQQQEQEEEEAADA